MVSHMNFGKPSKGSLASVLLLPHNLFLASWPKWSFWSTSFRSRHSWCFKKLKRLLVSLRGKVLPMAPKALCSLALYFTTGHSPVLSLHHPVFSSDIGLLVVTQCVCNCSSLPGIHFPGATARRISTLCWIVTVRGFEHFRPIPYLGGNFEPNRQYSLVENFWRTISPES